VGAEAFPGSTASPDAIQLGAEAVASISYPWQQQLPGWRIEFHPARSGYLGLSFLNESVMEIYVRPTMTAADIAAVVAHELGHAVDVTLLDDADRDAWVRQRGLPEHLAWYPTEESDLASGAGDFAEAFAVLLTGSWSQSRLAGQPTAADLALMAHLASVPG
jgi:hypothetical protein